MDREGENEKDEDELAATDPPLMNEIMNGTGNTTMNGNSSVRVNSPVASDGTEGGQNPQPVEGGLPHAASVGSSITSLNPSVRETETCDGKEDCLNNTFGNGLFNDTNVACAINSPVRAGGEYKKAVDYCAKDAFLLMMAKNCTKTRERINSLPPDTEEEVTGKRRLQMSPDKTITDPKKAKIERDPLSILEDMLKVLETQVIEQTTVKRETKNQMRAVIQQFQLYKRAQDQKLLHEKWRGVSKAEAAILAFKQRISEATELDKIDALILEAWPQGTYTSTKVNTHSKGLEDESVLYSVLVHPENFKEDRNLKAVQEKIPAIKSITAENLREMGSIPVSQEESTAIPGITEGSRRKTDILIASATLSDVGGLETADIINWADNMAQRAEKIGKEKIVITFPSDLHVEKIRKVLECRLSALNLKVHLCPKEKKKPLPSQMHTDNAITISGGTSYADMLKMMKESITPETMGIKVKSIHQTLSGALRLTVAETTSGAKDKLVEKIRGLAPDTHVRAYGNSKAVVITDIEQDATQSTVEEALALSLGMPKDDIRVTELRNSYRGTKSTTAYLPLQAALKAIELSKLKVGWTMANIK